ncbi:hypothetical protein [Paenarthrobacter ureafaciens]|uniref:hypothetical protein n=1 Tax=Paenarthrobacter ureafaciens TaxID=37931 RepID=UPI0009ACDF19|nr:hypothetical protein Pure01_05530 [Paenarthrobacter ureafaciens]GLU62583.1 hypothetical protein Pure02_08330 [Paenarthrobacter ureafaciens]GLU66929.1 hypothetical protein Pure03_09050 [Paenarthrobacter ureafaciens]GLU70769.1 hypothetical protein Pure04_04840 [Paenarthrobacter ureafaciens]GLU75390.1 hypothetical protein Pure05_08300 [Paenarthrobacter ureafaciens]
MFSVETVPVSRRAGTTPAVTESGPPHLETMASLGDATSGSTDASAEDSLIKGILASTKSNTPREEQA